MKKVPDEMWEQIYRACRQRADDESFDLRSAIVQIGLNWQWTHRDLIDNAVLDERRHPRRVRRSSTPQRMAQIKDRRA